MGEMIEEKKELYEIMDRIPEMTRARDSWEDGVLSNYEILHRLTILSHSMNTLCVDYMLSRIKK